MGTFLVANVPLVCDIVDTLKYLYEKGHDLVVVTAVPANSRQCAWEKIEWVEHYLPFIGYDNFVATRRKSVVNGDLLFDDGPHNLREFTGKTCAMDAPYNRKAHADYRVHNWSEFKDLVDGLE